MGMQRAARSHAAACGNNNLSETKQSEQSAIRSACNRAQLTLWFMVVRDMHDARAFPSPQQHNTTPSEIPQSKKKKTSSSMSCQKAKTINEKGEKIAYTRETADTGDTVPMAMSKPREPPAGYKNMIILNVPVETFQLRDVRRAKKTR
jgi:hypothetical protein